MTESKKAFPAKLKLRHLLFLFLIVFGVFPLIFTTVTGVLETRPVLEREEQVNLSRQAESLAARVGEDLTHIEKQLRQLGVGPGGFRECPRHGR